ncbi:MAG: hypothetical protein Q8K60_00545 [Parachlamydiaceae bacterium]|nr:hypothetical protein [Parachlamydiaceae bacterium]
MRKQLGILASLVFLGAMALFGTSCTGSNQYRNDCCEPCERVCEPNRPVCPPSCNPVCQPQCAPQYAPPCNPCPPQHEMHCRPCDEPCQQHFDEPCAPPCAPRVNRPCPPPCEQPCPPPCAQPQQPCPPPCDVCPPKCAAPLKPCKYGTSGECACNGVTVRARNPNMCMLGDQYPLDFDVIACCDVCEAIVSTTLPEGVSYMRSQPEAKVEGRKLTWTFGSISKGQSVPARVWLKCDREGDLCTCFCVQATPVAFCALLCAKPVLVCEKCGPLEVCPGDPINYTITVTNIGTCTAEDVVITDTLPDGVEGPDCKGTLTFRLGCLEPCQTKKVNFTVKACKRGKICNTAVVTACNANQTSCEFCTCVCCCAIECDKVGPKELSVGQNAEYQITVVNTGDKSLHEVVVTDQAPSATSIVAAPGACINCKQAVWKLRELKPGEKVTFNLTLTTCTPGYFSNRVNVTNCEGCNSCCEFGTHWKGRPALDVCVTNSDNPICVGETTRLKVTVTNTGQEYDSDVKIVATFPEGLVPVSASGASGAQVNGNTVTFAPIANFAPRQTAEATVIVKGTQAGDLRPQFEVSSATIKPIRQEESIIVN